MIRNSVKEIVGFYGKNKLCESMRDDRRKIMKLVQCNSKGELWRKFGRGANGREGSNCINFIVKNIYEFLTLVGSKWKRQGRGRTLQNKLERHGKVCSIEKKNCTLTPITALFMMSRDRLR